MEAVLCIKKRTSHTIIKVFPHTKGLFDHTQCVKYAQENKMFVIPTQNDIDLINTLLCHLEFIFDFPRDQIIGKTRKATAVTARIIFFYMLRVKTTLKDSCICCFLAREHAFARFAKIEHNYRLQDNHLNYLSRLKELILMIGEDFYNGSKRFIIPRDFKNKTSLEMRDEFNLFKRFAISLGHLNIDHKITEFFESIRLEQLDTIEILEFKDRK